MIRVLLVLAALLTLAACDDEPQQCALYYLESGGKVRDEAGNPITPTRVVRRDEHGEHTCEPQLGSYLCGETSSRRAEVTVFVDERSWTQSAKTGYDGCHEHPAPLDFVLDKLPVCEPAAAVEGTLPASGASDDDLVVTFESIAERQGDLMARAECDLDPPTYSCPALRQYEGGAYLLRLESRFGKQEVELQVPASDCQVETQHHDFE